MARSQFLEHSFSSVSDSCSDSIQGPISARVSQLQSCRNIAQHTYLRQTAKKTTFMTSTKTTSDAANACIVFAICLMAFIECNFATSFIFINKDTVCPNLWYALYVFAVVDISTAVVLSWPKRALLMTVGVLQFLVVVFLMVAAGFWLDEIPRIFGSECPKLRFGTIWNTVILLAGQPSIVRVLVICWIPKRISYLEFSGLVQKEIVRR